MSCLLADCAPKAKVYLKKGEFVEVFAFNSYPWGLDFSIPTSYFVGAAESYYLKFYIIQVLEER